MPSNSKTIEGLSTRPPSFTQVDSAIRGLNVSQIEQENTLLPASLGDSLQRLVTIYNGVKPLLAVLTMLPLIPSRWARALALFNQALEAVVAVVGAGGITANFKAGKDL